MVPIHLTTDLLLSKFLVYLEVHGLINDRQYGFRHCRSGGNLLVYLTYRWSAAIESKGEDLAVSLDMVQTLDRVWHRAPLSKFNPTGFSRIYGSGSSVFSLWIPSAKLTLHMLRRHHISTAFIFLSFFCCNTHISLPYNSVVNNTALCTAKYAKTCWRFAVTSIQLRHR